MASPSSANMVIPNQLDQIPRVQQAILEQARQAGFDSQALFGIRLALEEALTNAIQHGNNADPDKHVTIHFAVESDQLSVKICDQGTGFVPEQLPDPTDLDNLTRPCGRGVLLMRAYMTDVQYNEAGNCVTLIKKRDDPTPDPQ